MDRSSLVLRSSNGFTLVGALIVLVVVIVVALVIWWLVRWLTRDDDVHSVEVIPPEVYAEAGAQFRLRARARDKDGSVIIIPNSAFKWSGSLQFVPDEGEYTVVTAPQTAGNVQISDGEWTVYGLTVKAGGETSDPFVLHVTPGTGLTSRDRIGVPHTTGAVPEVLMIDAASQSSQINDMTLAVAGMALLNIDLQGGQREWAAFAPDMAMLYEKDSPQWSAGHNDVRRSRAQFGNSWPVKVVLRFAVSDLNSGKIQAQEELALASALFAANRVGVAFESEVSWEAGADYLNGPTDCEQLGGSYGIDVSHDSLHVLYIEHWDSWDKGVSCRINGSRLIVIPLNRAVTTTLAHELAHLLGLEGFYSPNGGHTGGCIGADTISGFDETNLMYGCLDVDKAAARDWLSLGQVFRMNVDERSWLNQTRADGTRLRDGATVPCQCNPYANMPCPALSADFIPVTENGVEDPCAP
jgi:hypothetical protein